MPFHTSSFFVNGDQPVGAPDIAIVIDSHIGQFAKSPGEVLQNSRKPAHDLLRGDIVPPLRHSHGNSLVRHVGILNSNKQEYNRIAGCGRILEEADLCPVGKLAGGGFRRTLALRPRLIASTRRSCQRSTPASPGLAWWGEGAPLGALGTRPIQQGKGQTVQMPYLVTAVRLVGGAGDEPEA